MNSINGTPITRAFVLMVALLLGFAGLDVSASPQSGDAEPTGADGAASTTAADAPKTAAEISSLSIVDRAPIVLNVNRRYYKFYGDAFTVNGGLLERSQLTGDWGGARDTLADSGFNFDFGITQNFMSNVDGGTSTGGLQYSGSLDMFANIDTAKLTKGAWPRATIFLHLETRWDQGVQADAGSLIPPVYDDVTPRAETNDNAYLSEYYLIQALSDEFSLWIGQMDGAGLADGNAFANSEKHQFMNTALVDNPILGPFAHYTGFSANAVWIPSKEKEHVFIVGALDGNGTVNKTVASTYRGSDTVYTGSYIWLPEFDGLTGRYQILGGYTDKNFTDYALDDQLELARILIGIDTPIEASDNYVVIGMLQQYLYVKDKKRMTGWGLFSRFGWAPDDRNAIDQFYSFGVGGKGCLFPGRDNDFWGVGWAGTHFSSDLRRDLEILGVDSEDFEHVIEAFYNIELTPAVHLTLDGQYILDPFVSQILEGTGGSVSSDSSALVLGMRLQLDF